MISVLPIADSSQEGGHFGVRVRCHRRIGFGAFHPKLNPDFLPAFSRQSAIRSEPVEIRRSPFESESLFRPSLVAVTSEEASFPPPYTFPSRPSLPVDNSASALPPSDTVLAWSEPNGIRLKSNNHKKKERKKGGKGGKGMDLTWISGALPAMYGRDRLMDFLDWSSEDGAESFRCGFWDCVGGAGIGWRGNVVSVRSQTS